MILPPLWFACRKCLDCGLRWLTGLNLDKLRFTKCHKFDRFLTAVIGFQKSLLCPG